MGQEYIPVFEPKIIMKPPDSEEASDSDFLGNILKTIEEREAAELAADQARLNSRLLDMQLKRQLATLGGESCAKGVNKIPALPPIWLSREGKNETLSEDIVGSRNVSSNVVDPNQQSQDLSTAVVSSLTSAMNSDISSQTEVIDADATLSHDITTGLTRSLESGSMPRVESN